MRRRALRRRYGRSAGASFPRYGRAWWLLGKESGAEKVSREAVAAAKDAEYEARQKAWNAEYAAHLAWADAHKSEWERIKASDPSADYQVWFDSRGASWHRRVTSKFKSYKARLAARR